MTSGMAYDRGFAVENAHTVNTACASKTRRFVPRSNSDRSKGDTQQFRDHRFESGYQFRVHELIVVRDTQADNSLLVEILFEFPLKPVLVSLLHDKDNFRPEDEFWCQYVYGVRIQACRHHFKIGMIPEDFLSCRASELVLTANEKDSLHGNFELFPHEAWGFTPAPSEASDCQ